MLFRNTYEQLTRKAESLQRGQMLFGLPVMNVAALRTVGRQMEMLQRLYGLYSDVHKVVNGFKETPWKEANCEEIEYQLVSLQSRSAG